MDTIQFLLFFLVAGVVEFGWIIVILVASIFVAACMMVHLIKLGVIRRR